MSKLDQLKALGDAKRAARNNSGGRASAQGRKLVPDPTIGKTRVSQENGVRVAPNPPDAKRGRGRPKVEGPRPWETAGVSKTTYYRERRRDEQKGTRK